MTETTVTTAIIQIAPSLDLKVQGLVDEIQKILTFAELRVITTDDDLPPATNDLTVMANLTKAINGKKKEYCDPIKGYLKSVQETFELISKPLAEADQITRGKIMAYRQAQETKRIEIERINRLRMEAAEAEAKLNGDGVITQSVNLIPEAPAPIKKVTTEAGSLGTMKVTKWEVENFALLSDEYKIVDGAKVGAVVRASKGTITISGIRIWIEETLSVRAR